MVSAGSVLAGLAILLLLATSLVALQLRRLAGRRRWIVLDAGMLGLGLALVVLLVHFQQDSPRSVLEGGLLAGLAALLLATLLVVRDLLIRLTGERESLSAILGTMEALVVVFDPDGTIVRFNAGCERLTGYRAEEVEGRKTWESFVPERERDEVAAVFGGLAAGDRQSRHESHWVDRRGREHLIAWRNSVITGEEGGVRFVIATGIDVTEQRRMDRAREALYQVIATARQARDPEELFPVVHRALNQVMDASNFFVALYDAERDLLRFPYYVDEQDPATPDPSPPQGTLTGYVLRTGRPLLADPERFAALVRDGGVDLVGPDSIDWMGVPLIVDGETFGVMAVQSYRESVRYSEADLRLLGFMADQVARLLEQTRAAQALREREARYRLLFTQAPVGIFQYDRDLIVTECNEALAAMLQTTPERVVGLDIRKLRDQSILPAALAALEGREGRYEGWYRPTTGERTVWGVLRTTPLRAADGRITGAVAIVLDETRRKEAEEASRRREAILTALSRAGSLFLKTEDPADALEDALEALGRATGVSGVHLFQNRSTAAGGTICRRKLSWTARGDGAAARPRVLETDLYPERIGFRRWEELMRLGRPVHGPVGSLPLSERRLLGGLGIRSVAAFPILVSSRWWGFLLFEDRERAREWAELEVDTLQLAADTLSAALQHRAIEQQLVSARKMEAIGQLAGGIAHDFNNLLMAIYGSAEQLHASVADSPKGEANLRVIKEAAERAASMTRRLLAFAKRQVIELVPLDLNEVVDLFLPTLRRMIPEHITVDFIPGQALGTVLADATQIERVLINLCANARDAMPDGGTITLETENVIVNGEFIAAHPWAKKGRYVLLSVTDTGEGMTPQTLERAFEPFFTTKGADRGTGMGLATVYGIVKQHGGMVHLYSEEGKGTTVKIYLPVSSRRATTVGTKIEVAVQGGRETVLVVEDDPAVREVMQSLLEDLGYTVLTAEDGAEALDRLRALDGAVDLVVSDIIMPNMGGQELYQRSTAEWPSIRFLFTTGYSENVVHRNFVKKKGVFFLTKPFGRDVLARKIREIIDEDG